MARPAPKPPVRRTKAVTPSPKTTTTRKPRTRRPAVTEEPPAAPVKPVRRRRKPVVVPNDAIVETMPDDVVVTPEPVGDHATIPAERLFDSYLGRKVWGVDFMDIFDVAMRDHQNILIEGPTGSGKTSAIVAYAAKRRLPFYSVSSSIGLEPSQLFGKFIPGEEAGTVVWQDGPVTTLVRHGGVLLLNEVNFIPSRVGTVLFSLLDGRRQIQLLDHRGEVVVAHPDLLIIADMNPDYAGTQSLNTAFRNRFVHQLPWEYDPVVEKQLVKSDVLRSLAVKVRNETGPAGSYDTPLATNMLMEFERNVASLGLAFAIGNVIQHYNADERQAISMVFDSVKRELAASYEPPKPTPAPSVVAAPDANSMYDIDWDVNVNDLGWAFDMKGSTK